MGENGTKDPWEELVANNPTPRNWRGIFISLLVILMVILFVALSVKQLTPEDPGLRVRGERIRLDQILEEKFQPSRYNATYINGSLVYITGEGGLSVYSQESGTSSTLLDNTTFRLMNSVQYKIDDQLEHVLIASEQQSIFRHSTLAKYTVFNTKERDKPLIRLGQNASDQMLQDQERLQYAALLPGGNKGAVFVSHNDLYYMPKLVSEGKVHRITRTGKTGTVYNGVADWLYEEEILGRSDAIWFSSNGASMAFATFNDSDVSLITLREYGNLDHSKPGMKIREKAFRYPKAGAKNPRVSLHVVNMEGNNFDQTTQVTPPKDLINKDHYLIEAEWLSSTELCVLWTNRPQNIAYYTICRHPDYVCKQILVERASDVFGAGWVDHWGIPTFSKDLKQMIKIHPLRHDNGEYYPQLVYIPVSTSHLIPPTQLTSRKAEVTQIHGWDQHTGFVYYTSTEEDRPGERYLFRLNVTSPHRRPEELTDSILCKYSRIHMAKDLSSYVQECLGPDVPWVKYKTLPDNWPRFWLDKNEKVLNQIAYSSMPRNLFTSVQLPGTATSARVQLILPPVLRETEDFMFPLIVNLYGGPGSQTVDERWSVGWHTYLASNRDFIVANIDVRGSGYQGLSTKHSVSGQLGTLEASDVLHTVRELIKMYKFIDESKVCVWGWSFGGFLTARVLALDGENSMQGKESVFSCGIAVAPVAQWQDYDSAYTEKYMGLPSPGNNWKGYLEASLTNQAENIADNKFMVLHGTGDDNVHVHHTMVLSKELVKHQIIFRQQLYPDESHGLFGVIKHQHLTMETFLDQIFGPIEDHFRDDYYLAAAILVQDLNLENKENEES